MEHVKQQHCYTLVVLVLLKTWPLRFGPILNLLAFAPETRLEHVKQQHCYMLFWCGLGPCWVVVHTWCDDLSRRGLSDAVTLVCCE